MTRTRTNASVTRWRLARRALLRRLGLGAACLPLLRATRGLAATDPRRLLVIQMTQGYRQAAWKPSTGSLLTQQLPNSSAPFAQHREDMVFLPDLANPGIGAAGLGGYGVMFYGLGGTGAGEFLEPTGPTLDQVVANGLPRPAGSRPSLHLGVQVDRAPRTSPAPGSSHCFWRGTGQPIEPIGDPLAVYRELFSGGTPGGVPAGSTARLLARRKSILDYVGTNLEGFGKRVGSEDRQAIDGHLQAIRELEGHLQGVAKSVASAAAPPPGIDLQGAASYPLILKAHLQLMVAAIRSGVTRVVTLQTSDAAGYNVEFGTFAPGQPMPNPSTRFRSWGELGASPIQDGVDQKRLVDQWFMERFAELLSSMKAVPEVTGSLLDNTVVVIGNYLQDGANKDAQKAPWMLAGRGGYFATGNCLASEGHPIASVMAGICEAVGVQHRYGEVLPGLKRG